jgi:primosomal protein N'
VSVAVPVPRLGLLTYRASKTLTLAAGSRVRVPLGSRQLTGWVVDTDVPAPTPPPGAKRAIAVKEIAEVIDPDPFFPHDVIRLALWTAEYYLCGPGETLAAAAPPLTRTRDSAFKQQRVARLGRPAADDERLTEKQRDALAKLSEAAEGIPIAVLQKEGLSSAVLSGLAARGLVAIEDEVVQRDPFADEETRQSGAQVSPLAIEPTEDQRRVLADLARRRSISAWPTRSGDWAAASSCWCPRSRSRRRWPRSSAAPSAIAWRFNTAASPTASATINGIASARAPSTSSSARAPRCGRRCRTSG